MAISINYSTNIINVPKADTQFVSLDPITSLEVRQLDITTFGKALGNVQDEESGAWASTAYEYTAPINVGGVQLAPVLVILNPYRVTFEDGQYAVNLVGGNTNIQDYVTVNQVSIRPGNSAGLTFSDAINEQSFQDAAVWVNSTTGNPGTGFPRGTTTDPVDNPADALVIAAAVNILRFRVQGAFTPTSLDASGSEIVGNSPASAVITATNLTVENAFFEMCTINGSLIGSATYADCMLASGSQITGFDGLARDCGLGGTIVAANSGSGVIVFKDCISAIAGSTKPIFDCNGGGGGFNFRRYTGGLKIINFNNAAARMTLDLVGGDVAIDSVTCTAGEIVIRGIGLIADQNGTPLPRGSTTWNGITIKNSLMSNRYAADELLDTSLPR